MRPAAGCGRTTYLPTGSVTTAAPLASRTTVETSLPPASRIVTFAPGTGRGAQAGSPSVSTGHVGPAAEVIARPVPGSTGGDGTVALVHAATMRIRAARNEGDRRSVVMGPGRPRPDAGSRRRGSCDACAQLPHPLRRHDAPQ